MTDMNDTIIPKSDQLNADSLTNGRTLTIKISKVTIVGGDQPVTVHFDGDDGKPYKPGKSMRRVMVKVWGPDANKYIGKSMTLYCDEKVKFGGMDVGGIRISHMSHITDPVTMALTATKGSKKPFTVKPLAVKESAPAPEANPELVSDGLAAALNGVKSYTEWLGALSPEDKATIKPHHAAWSKTAKEKGE
jgi:hypothetical protein